MSSSKSKYTRETAHAALQRNGHIIEAPRHGDVDVTVIKTRGYVGLKTWSVIDYLCNHQQHFYHGGIAR